VAPDALLALVFVGLLSLRPPSAFAPVLMMAIAFVLAWSVLTLHFPAKVELTDEGLSFFGYGRAHHFLWRDIERIRVRRFLVRDRVLVCLRPSPPWRGRYWILDGIEGYDRLVAKLESTDSTA
jgi:hypothetical protein